MRDTSCRLRGTHDQRGNRANIYFVRDCDIDILYVISLGTRTTDPDLVRSGSVVRVTPPIEPSLTLFSTVCRAQQHKATYELLTTMSCELISDSYDTPASWVYSKPYEGYITEGSAYNVVRRVAILASAYGLSTMPTHDKFLVWHTRHDGVQKYALQPWMFHNMLRLGTPHVRASSENPQITIDTSKDDYLQTQEGGFEETDHSETADTRPSEKVSVVRSLTMERCLVAEDQTYIFEAIRTSDFPSGPKEPAGDPKILLRTTARSSPALISLFVAMGAQLNPETSEKGGQALFPSYVAQPLINMRCLSDVTRLTHPNSEGETMLQTAAGETKKTLVMMEMVGTVYVTKPRSEAYPKTNTGAPVPGYGVVRPMLIVGIQEGGEEQALCDSPTATALVLSDVVSLWKILFSENCLQTQVIEEKLHPRVEALFRFNSLMTRLHQEYNGLVTLADWVKLYGVLRKYLWFNQNVSNNLYYPRCANDLYNDCRVMLLAVTPIRIGLLDGLARVATTIYTLMGRTPELSIEDVDGFLPTQKNIQFKDIMYTMTGATVTLRLVDFAAEEKGLTNEPVKFGTLHAYKTYSAIIQNTVTAATSKAMVECMVEIVQTMQNTHFMGKRLHLKPGEYKSMSNVSNEEEVNLIWMRKLRVSTCQALGKMARGNAQVLTIVGSDFMKHDEDDLSHLLDTKKRFTNKAIHTRQIINAPEKLSCVLMLLTQFQYDSGETERDKHSLKVLLDFVRYNCRGEYKGDLGIMGTGKRMRGLFPEGKDGVSVYSFERPYLSLVHLPTTLLGGAVFKYMKGARSVGNLGTRYTMAAGTAVLELYNLLGPMMAMAPSCSIDFSYLWKYVLNVNPFSGGKKKPSSDDYPAFNWYDTMTERQGSERLYSNIPTFISFLLWMAIRSEDDKAIVPDDEKLFYIHRHPRHKYFTSLQRGKHALLWEIPIIDETVKIAPGLKKPPPKGSKQLKKSRFLRPGPTSHLSSSGGSKPSIRTKMLKPLVTKITRLK
jgi:hypothetical protein